MTTDGALPGPRLSVRRIFAQSLGTFGAQLAGLALSLVSAALIARWLGPEGKGQIAVAMLVPGVLSLLLGSGVGVAGTFLVASGRTPLARLSGNVAGLGLVVSAAGLAAALLLFRTGLLARVVPGLPPHVLLLALAAFPLGIFAQYVAGLVLGMQQIRALNRISVAQGALSTALVALLVAGIGLGVPGAIVASLAAASAGLLLQVRLLRRLGARFAPRLEGEVLRPALSYGLRANVANLMQFFNYRLDVFVVNFLVGAGPVGIYGVAVALAELLWQWPNAVGLVLFPKSSAGSTRDAGRALRRVLWLTTAVTVAGALALALFGRLAIRIVFGPRFDGAFVPLLLLLPGVVLLGTGKVLSNDIAGRGHPELNSINSGLALVLTLAGNLLLVPRFGIAGAALASTLAYGANFLLAVVFHARVRRHPRAAGTSPS